MIQEFKILVFYDELLDILFVLLKLMIVNILVIPQLLLLNAWF